MVSPPLLPFSSAGTSIAALAEQLAETPVFEEAARVVLATAIALVERALGRSPFAKAGRVVRGVVHLRPADGYRGLVVVETGAAKKTGEGAAEAHLTSTTAWRWVAATRRARSRSTFTSAESNLLAVAPQRDFETRGPVWTSISTAARPTPASSHAT